MILTDANVLIYAFRRDAEQHAEYRAWLERAISEETAFGVTDLVLSAVVRISTHPRVFAHPSKVEEALEFCDFLLGLPNAVRVVPNLRHWGLFADLCRRSHARGNLITDAYLSALAIEIGAELITTDRDFARFPGLRWRHPLT